MKTYEDQFKNKISSQKSEIAQWKHDKRKTDEKSLQLCGMGKKATKKL